jgi:hypothetical protein
MWAKLKRWFALLVIVPFQRKKVDTTTVQHAAPPSPPPEVAPAPQPEAIPAAEASVTPQTQAPADYEEKYNRAMRRAMERARRRHDKFVKPKGKRPEPKPCRKQEQEEKPAEVSAATEDQVEVEVARERMTDAEWKEYLKHNPCEFVGQHQVSGEDVLFLESEMWGQFSFRDTILDQLDRYFVYLRRMRLHDRQGYEFYRQVGAQLLPYSALGHQYHKVFKEKSEKLSAAYIKKMHKERVLPPSFKKDRPAFGCFAFGTDPLAEREEMETPSSTGSTLFIPKFMYFTKYANHGEPSTLQHVSGGDIYKMTIYWDRPQDPKNKRKGGSPTEFGVFVSKDGQQIKVLKVLETVEHHVEAKRKRNGHKNPHKTTIPIRDWHYPDDYAKWCERMGVDPDLYLGHLFCVAVQDLEWHSVTRVSVTKGDMTAIFGVDPRRMGYFFKDRDLTFDENGVRKRVLHQVAAHMRKDGAAVRMHFRGEREFTWAGYKVLVTIPGRDHLPLETFNVGVWDQERMAKGRDAIGAKEVGAYLADVVAGGYGGTHSSKPLEMSKLSSQARRDAEKWKDGSSAAK